MLDTLCRTAALRSVGVHVVCVGWGWWVLHTRACSVSVGTAESCGTAMSVAIAVPLPCATPTTTTLHTEIGPLPARDRSSSARPTRRRSTHDKLRGQNHMPHLGNHRRTADPRKHDRSRRETQPISARVTTDLDASFDRSRGGTGPISARVTTDLVAEPDRSRRGGGEGMTKGRAGPRAARPLGVGRRRREETATPTPLALFPCQAREMREASSTCSGVGRTPV